MDDFDQAARYVAEAEPEALVAIFLRRAGLALRFTRWFPTRTIPRLRSPERDADHVAQMEDPVVLHRHWLMPVEFQTRPDPEKIDVLHEETGILRSRARWGDDRRGKFLVLPALVHLTGQLSESTIDLRTPTGHGTFFAPVVWDVEADSADNTLAAVAAGELSWALLFWVPLMSGGGEDIIITRWREVVTAVVPDEKRRGNLLGVVHLFAELARNYRAWERGLEGFNVGESQVANRWRQQGEIHGVLRTKRQDLLKTLAVRFPGEAATEVLQLIEQQDSLPVLEHWFEAALRAHRYAEFLDVLRR